MNKFEHLLKRLQIKGLGTLGKLFIANYLLSSSSLSLEWGFVEIQVVELVNLQLGDKPSEGSQITCSAKILFLD